jgi:ABC-type glucose/galactose transport system permease subunit
MGLGQLFGVSYGYSMMGVLSFAQYLVEGLVVVFAVALSSVARWLRRGQYVVDSDGGLGRG